MLTLTENASNEIRTIVDDERVPDGAGLRITADPAAGGLSLTLAATPAEDDQVLDQNGARVFLEPQAAQLLEDKSLDAVSDGSGTPQFTLTQQ